MIERNIPEIIGRKTGKQRQSDIRRRRTMGYHLSGLQLIIIGWQPVFLFGYKIFKIGPGFACSLV